MTDPVETMSGEAVLSMVRETVADESARISSIDEAFVRLGLDGPDPKRLACVRALNAAVDVLTLIIATGQDEKSKERKTYTGFVKRCADQARAALMTDGPGQNDDEPAA